jgi:hypothetical protein
MIKSLQEYGAKEALSNEYSDSDELRGEMVGLLWRKGNGLLGLIEIKL